jgi:hypothetical protein
VKDKVIELDAPLKRRSPRDLEFDVRLRPTL